jgi:hypothetical protein
MALGGLFAMSDRRYRLRVKETVAEPVKVPAVGKLNKLKGATR